jgi:hypothetical protein
MQRAHCTRNHGDYPRTYGVWTMNQQLVNFFDIFYSMSWGYVHEPRLIACSFLREPRFDCCKWHQAYKDHLRDKSIDNINLDDYRCTKQCDLCHQVCFDNDYVRCKLPPNYPVPATFDNACYAVPDYLWSWHLVEYFKRHLLAPLRNQ